MFNYAQEIEYEIYLMNYIEETDDNALSIEEYFENKEYDEEELVT